MINRQDRELLESSLFSKLWQNSPDNMFVLKIVDDDFYIVTSNVKQQEKAELDSPSIIDVPLRELLPDDVYQPIHQNYQRCISAKEPIQYSEEEVFTSSDGSPNYWNTILHPMLDDSGNVELIFGVSRNISELVIAQKKAVEAAEAAEKANQVKTNFLANMSHEMRTPLNGIKGALELIKSSEDPNEISELLTVIENSADALSRQTEDILDYAKLGNQKLQLDERIFSTIDLLKTNEAQLRNLAEQQKNKLIIDICDQVPKKLQGDPDRIQQILLNLGSNANKFTENGTVTIKVKHANRVKNKHQIYFSICDSGIGISEEDQLKLFKPFSQLDDSTTKKFPGTGLGLAICKNLVELMGGDITVNSAPAIGSEFSFSLWLQEPQACQLEKHTKPQNLSLEHLDLLLVEDNPTNQLITGKMLRKAGANVVIAEHGRQALEMCQQQTFDLILMDWHMPVMDGLKATEELRANEINNQRTPVIGLTANVMEKDREKCLRAGMSEVITKPVGYDTLIATVIRYSHSQGCELSG